MNIKIITVNFGDTNPTKSLVESISLCSLPKKISISIADNSSTIKSLKKLKKLKSKTKINIEIFSNEKNFYYWPAAKKIISSLCDSKKDTFPNWILICNNDVLFKDKKFFKKLEKIDLVKYPIIGPEIINGKGHRLNPFMNKPLNFFSRLYWRVYFFSYPSSILISKIKELIKLLLFNNKVSNIDSTKAYEVYSVHGSAILFSSYFFKSGGWLDDNFDLYGEELTVAEIAKKLSIPINYLPNLILNHDEHTSTKNSNQRILFNKARDSYRYINSTYFIK